MKARLVMREGGGGDGDVRLEEEEFRQSPHRQSYGMAGAEHE
jgi:hypothetical protein